MIKKVIDVPRVVEMYDPILGQRIEIRSEEKIISLHRVESDWWFSPLKNHKGGQQVPPVRGKRNTQHK